MKVVGEGVLYEDERVLVVAGAKDPPRFGR
jgi:hypothetical protein